MFKKPKNILRLLKVNLFAQSAIIITGAIVRITKSGLGCPTWPQCVGDSIIPLSTQEESWHKYVEFGNRLLTFVLLIVAVLVLVSIWRNQNLKKLRFLALTPMLGTIFQALLGGVTVLTGLHPTTVAAHFLVSIIIVAFAHTLVRKYQNPELSQARNWKSDLLVAIAFISIALGTVVTGTGPHSGDKNVDSRFNFDLATVANFHAKAIWAYCAFLAFLLIKHYRVVSPRSRQSLLILTTIVIAQGFLGYYQYFAGVPETLVFLHIIGSILFWISNLRVRADLAQDKSV